MKQKLLALTTATLLSSCCHTQTLRIEPVEGKGFQISIDASLLARELTDEEIEDADTAPGSGFHDAQKAAEHADHWVEVGKTV